MQENSTTRIAAYISLTGLFVLCVASLLYYKERMLFLDAPFIVYNIITEGRLYIQENRFGAFITQIVPLIGSKMHWPLKTILLSYSLSFNLFYLSVGFILTFVLKQYRKTILLCFYYLLFASEAFFWTNNEVFQATAWMMLAFGVLCYGQKSTIHPFRLLLFTPLIFTAIFTHAAIIPVVLLLYTYYLYINNRFTQLSAKAFISIVIISTIAAKLVMSNTQSYDSGKMHNALYFSLHDIISGLGSDFSKAFIKRCIYNYWAASILFIYGMTSIFIRRQYKLFSICLLGTIGYYVLICLVFGNLTDHHLFYIESEMMGMVIIMCLPFVYYVLPAMKPAQALAVIAIVLAGRFVYIYHSAPKYTARVTLTTEILTWMNKQGVKKLAIAEDERVKNIMIEPWAAAAESIILSSMSNKPDVSFYFVKDSTAVPKDKYIYAGCFYNYKPEDMNTRYFSIDTTTEYTIKHLNEIVP